MIPEEVGIELATSHEGDLEGRWEDMMLSEIGQSQKDGYYMIPLILPNS